MRVRARFRAVKINSGSFHHFAVTHMPIPPAVLLLLVSLCVSVSVAKITIIIVTRARCYLPKTTIIHCNQMLALKQPDHSLNKATPLSHSLDCTGITLNHPIRGLMDLP